MRGLTKAAWVSVLLFGLGWAHCGDNKAGPGQFCERDGDCVEPLVCRSNICVDPGSGDCDPPCQAGVETCFQGACIPVGDPNDKDGDGHQAGADCNDFDAAIFPGAYEYCDGVDNDCDSAVDEDCPACQDGDVQACGTDLGECTTGVQSCSSGHWEGCSGVGSQPEACDEKDNDCDGLTDETCPCQDGDQFPCGGEVGLCRPGTQVCENGSWTGCRNGELPQPEACDGADNDCDGTVDDGFNLQVACTGVGQCGAGLVECAAALDTRCSSMPGASQDESSTEVCDGADNDCDSLTDEGLEADQVPNTCNLGRNLGGLPDDGSEIRVRGNIWPAGDEDWLQVTATDDVAEDIEDLCDRFHFQLRFASRPADLQFDVYVGGCEGAAVDCLDDFEYDHAYDSRWPIAGTPDQKGQCYCRTGEETGYNHCTEEPKTFFIRIHAGPSGPTCEEYELVLTNGLTPNPA